VPRARRFGVSADLGPFSLGGIFGESAGVFSSPLLVDIKTFSPEIHKPFVPEAMTFFDPTGSTFLINVESYLPLPLFLTHCEAFQDRRHLRPNA